MPLIFKLLILILIMCSGLIIVATIAKNNIGVLKKSVDTIYFGSVVPISELREIDNSYSKIIRGSYEACYTDIELKKIVNSIDISISVIEDNFQKYNSHYHTDDEKKKIDFIGKNIFKLQKDLEKIVPVFLKGNKKEICKLIDSGYIDKVKRVKTLTESILNYEIENAQVEKNSSNGIYKETSDRLFWVILSTMILAISLTIPVLINIIKSQKDLENKTNELKILNEELTSLSIKDALTGLFNRRFFNEVSQKAIKFASIENLSVAMLIIDIDHFKQYNDTYGHQEGDEALKAVATAIKNSVTRQEEFAFRLGGEEFGVLLSDTNLDAAVKFANKIRNNVLNLKIPHKKNSASEFVTISLGVSVTAKDETEKSIDQLIKESDDALYKAKESGRNRVVYFS